jgi:hypothetical protein
MSRYELLFSICVNHAYYSDDICRLLHFIPWEGTARVMEKTGMLLKQEENRINVFFEQEKLENIKMYVDDAFDPLSFIFKVYSKDLSFLNHTEPEILTEKKILFFSNKKAESVSANITTEGVVSESDYADMASPPINTILPKHDRNVRPHFILAISPDKSRNQIFNKQGDPVRNRYDIKFLSRKTYWKYIVTGKNTDENLVITDKADKVKFSGIESPDLSLKTKTHTFISDRPMALKEIPACCFELKVDDSQACIIRKLPSAFPDIIFKMQDPNRSEYFSEIFLNI